MKIGQPHFLPAQKQNNVTKMPEDEEKSSIIFDFPTEVLLHIFTYLPGRQLARSRQVCVRWKHIIERLLWSDCLWQEHCRKDFANVYKIARRQSRPGLLWFNIYRSLALWPQLKYARELRDEFASAAVHNDELKNVKVLNGGIIGVHKHNSIAYYDSETLEPSKRRSIPGMYSEYTENAEAIVIQSDFSHLYIVRKFIKDPDIATRTTIHDVKVKLLLDTEVYYVTKEDEIYVVKLEEGNLGSHFIQRSAEPVMALGYTDCLNLITYGQKIYSIHDHNLVLKSDLRGCTDLLHQLKDHNLLETVHWKIMYQWHCMWGQRITDGPFKNIVVVKVYGDMVFVGCDFGVLRIYHKPYIAGTFDFYHSEPVKQYNFMERNDCPVLSSRCQIRQVDVLETEDGHTVIVCMPKKIAVLNYVHYFKRTASVAMLPYSDVQRMKVIKI